MKGIELALKYYEEFGKPMLEEKFKDKLNRICVGLVGHGSECFGFDDEVSQDHDFEPGFCIWLTEEDERDFGFRLFRAYQELPTEYLGISIQDKSLFGSDTKGVHTIEEFYSFYTGSRIIPNTLEEWMNIPDFYLAEATNGIVFADPVGEFTKIRNQLLHRPNDVRLKKLASCIFNMAQIGQYNYERCMKHGEFTAAAVCLADYAKYTAQAIYLLNNAYAPYYKWLFKGLKNLSILSDVSLQLEDLMKEPYHLERSKKIIEEIAQKVIQEIRNQGLSERTEDYLEPYAYCINDKIKDGNLRTLPIMQ